MIYSIYNIIYNIIIYNMIMSNPQTDRSRFLIVVYGLQCLQCVLSVIEFTTTISNRSFTWRLWMLKCNESWCFMCRYNDILCICWWYLQSFRLLYWAPKDDFQFKQEQNARMPEWMPEWMQDRMEELNNFRIDAKKMPELDVSQNIYQNISYTSRWDARKYDKKMLYSEGSLEVR